MAKAKAVKAPRYAVKDGPAFVKLMARMGAGSMKLEIARDALRRRAVQDEEVATVEDVLEALRADSRVFPDNLERYERLAEVGEEYWDDEGNVVKENVRALPNIEDELTTGNVKAAMKRLRGDASADELADLEPGGLDRTDSPIFHTEDAAADETRAAVGDAVSDKEAQERAEAARKEAAKPPTTPQTTGVGPGVATTSPTIPAPGTGHGSRGTTDPKTGKK